MKVASKLSVLALCLAACNSPEVPTSVGGPHESASARPTEVPLTPTVRTTKPDAAIPYRAPAVLPDAGQPDGSFDAGLGVDPSRR